MQRVRSGGYILGDEGSGAAMGRLFVGDILKGLVPVDLRDKFVEEFGVTFYGIKTKSGCCSLMEMQLLGKQA